MKELLALNHGIDPTKVEEKQTILLPAGRLSSRDKEILSGAPQPPRPSSSPLSGRSLSLQEHDMRGSSRADMSSTGHGMPRHEAHSAAGLLWHVVQQCGVRPSPNDPPWAVSGA